MTCLYDFIISLISNIAGVDCSTNYSFGCVNIVYGVTDSEHDSRPMELNDLPAIRKQCPLRLLGIKHAEHHYLSGTENLSALG